MLSASPSEAPNSAAPALALHGADIHKIPQILPRERVFPIQIGGELFKLSGASLSSDGALFARRNKAQKALNSIACLACFADSLF